jgi:uracil-xanthine permease
MSQTQSYFPTWRPKDGVGADVMPDERLPLGQTVLLGFQHVVAMFGATALMPILMGFDPNLAIFFSGIGTLIFFVATGGRVPSYLGSSAAFVAVVIAATGYAGTGPNPNVAVALGGIIVAGALYALVGLVIGLSGYAWIERLMPPVVTGAIVAAIGLNLAPIATRILSGSAFDTWFGLFTVALVGLITVYAPGLARRLPILIGAGLSYLAYFVLANGLGLAKPIDFSGVAAAPWIGLPHFVTPVFEAGAIGLIAPAFVVLVAENLGHIKAIGAMTSRNLDPWIARAFVGDGIATMVSGALGGTGVTTYAENMGVMAMTRIFSTLVFVAAGLTAILFGLCPKFGALILTIPTPVIGGLSVVVFGLIAATAGRIWVQSRTDFSEARNLITVGVALVLGAGDLTLKFGAFALGGIGTATFGAILVYHGLGRRPRAGEPEAVRPATGGPGPGA